MWRITYTLYLKKHKMCEFDTFWYERPPDHEIKDFFTFIKWQADNMPQQAYNIFVPHIPWDNWAFGVSLCID